MGLQSHRPCPQSRPQVLKFLSPCYSRPCHWRPCPHSRFPRPHPNKWVPAPGSPASIGDPAGPEISPSIPPPPLAFLPFFPLSPQSLIDSLFFSPCLPAPSSFALFFSCSLQVSHLKPSGSLSPSQLSGFSSVSYVSSYSSVLSSPSPPPSSTPWL